MATEQTATIGYDADSGRAQRFETLRTSGSGWPSVCLSPIPARPGPIRRKASPMALLSNPLAIARVLNYAIHVARGAIELANPNGTKTAACESLQAEEATLGKAAHAEIGSDDRAIVVVRRAFARSVEIAIARADGDVDATYLLGAIGFLLRATETLVATTIPVDGESIAASRKLAQFRIIVADYQARLEATIPTLVLQSMRETATVAMEPIHAALLTVSRRSLDAPVTATRRPKERLTPAEAEQAAAGGTNATPLQGDKQTGHGTANETKAVDPPPNVAGEQSSSKRRRGTGAAPNARSKLVAALTLHHKYADGGLLNDEPIGNNKLARMAGVDNSTASAFFKRAFKGHHAYTRLCARVGELAAALKILNGELAPHHLYGAKPPRERELDD